MKFSVRFQYFPLVVFGLLIYLVALVVTFPAERAYAHWQGSAKANRAVALSGISGSVWSGGAAVALIQGQPLRDLQWTLHPWSLLFGQVGLGWGFQLPESASGSESGYARAQTAFGLDGSVSVEQLEARLPAQWVAALAKAAAVRPAGVVSLNLAQLHWDGQNLVSAEGSVAWQGAGLNIFKPVALGDLSLQLENAEQAIKGVVSDGGGPLSLDGLLTLTADGKYEFNGSLAARNAPDLEAALRSLGRAGTDGRIKLKRAGSLASLGLF
ncbi:MAG: type II secretion system protein N [Gammaproteobacteria bacterium]|nr:type II secretion system protein N [Gammaproteobacteria bacterium]